MTPTGRHLIQFRFKEFKGTLQLCLSFVSHPSLGTIHAHRGDSLVASPSTDDPSQFPWRPAVMALSILALLTAARDLTPAAQRGSPARLPPNRKDLIQPLDEALVRKPLWKTAMFDEGVFGAASFLNDLVIHENKNRNAPRDILIAFMDAADGRSIVEWRIELEENDGRVRKITNPDELRDMANRILAEVGANSPTTQLHAPSAGTPFLSRALSGYMIKAMNGRVGIEHLPLRLDPDTDERVPLREQARLLVACSSILYGQGLHREAARTNRSAAACFERCDDPEGQVTALFFDLCNLRPIDEGAEMRSIAFEISRVLRARPELPATLRAQFFAHLGRVCEDYGDSESAAQLFAGAEARFKGVRNERRSAPDGHRTIVEALLNDRFLVHQWWRSNPDKAVASLEHTTAELRSIHDERAAVSPLLPALSIRVQQGRPRRALDYFLANESAWGRGTRWNQVGAYSAAGYLYKQMKDRPKSVQWSERALSIAKKCRLRPPRSGVFDCGDLFRPERTLGEGQPCMERDPSPLSTADLRAATSGLS